MNVNPDNVATPIAASLGDLVTLAILAYTSSSIHELSTIDDPLAHDQTLDVLDIASLGLIESMGMNLGILCCAVLLLLYFLFIAPVSFTKAKLVKETETVLYEGWTPGNYKSIKNIKGVIMRFLLITDMKMKRHDFYIFQFYLQW